MSRAPSAWLRRLVERALPESERHALGDLEEELAQRRRAGRSGVRTELWYAREALSLLWAARLEWRSAAWARSGGDGVGGTGRRGGLGEALSRDLAHVLRSLRRSPGTSMVIVLTLTVALGAATALFTVANAAFFRPLPYPDAERLVRVYSGSREDPTIAFSVSPLDWRDFGGFERIVEASAVWTAGESVHLTGVDEPSRLEAPRASADLFRLLGAQPVVGRFFLPEEEELGRDDAVVLSHGLWTRAYGADPDVVGRTMELDGRAYRIVGVAPPSGVLPREADAWRALALGPEWYEDDRWGWQFLQSVARLAPGVGVSEASEALNERLAVVNPDRAGRLGQTRLVRSLQAERAQRSGRAILMLAGAVGLLLALACANVMNVVRARSGARLAEFGLRRALGSGAGSLARLVALESLVLGAVGGLGGLALAALGLRAVHAAGIAALASVGPLSIDGGVLAFGMALTLTTAAVFGAAPVVDVVRVDPQAVLGDHAGRVGGSVRAARLRDGLVVLQVSLALTLLVSVVLAAGSFRSLVGSDPGFAPEGLLAVTVEAPRSTEADAALRASGASGLYRALLDRVGGIPGVESVSAVNFLPLAGVGWSSSFEIVEPDPAQVDLVPGANMRAVGPGYFETVGIPVLEGRSLGEADGLEGEPVAVVDATVARAFWPGRSPVGTRAVIGGLSSEPATIVGVVGDVPHESLDEPGGGHVYFPVLQSPQRRMTLVVRVGQEADPAALAPAIRAAVRDVEPRMPVTAVATLSGQVRESLSGLRLSVGVLAGFGLAATLLAALGIYGVLAFSVARRRSEIGVRVAMGAAPATVLREIVAQAMRLWLVGAAFGIAGAAGAASILSRYVAGVDVRDPASYVAVFGMLAIVALAAATVPALRAVRVDPVEALRPE